ncbi:Alpha-2-macroglobulin family N-terminal region [Formosa sp. Hel1_31_208]|uniref:alpha-2-macroglobulin family protein n=1 Tax=Formosa sp. Hel1_31_208 TaxID=1798225 RepID=UPI000879E3DF|nr:MG2 domain-containing protein [Formosa sp. Hel1_31_208]SDS05355.1 Alpha-2-macroglobulin family N-terminal region [Formosa sp. Hel1_31_208]
MKPFISLLMIICLANFTNAQTPEDFSKLWQQVANFESEGLPKSALEIVERIAINAKASHNSPQEIKTLLFRSKYALILEEDAQLKVVNDFKAAITQSEAPTKNVLQNILATLYWQYFNQNRWKFYNRTKTSDKGDDIDFRTWDLNTLFNEVHLNYQASMANGLILSQTNLKDFEAVLIKQPKSKRFRPSLYDLLAYNALEFYKTDENNITKPAFKFEINDPKFIEPTDRFGMMRFLSKDSTSLQLHALKIYQDLIKTHMFDDSPYAIAHADIERLNYVYQHGTFNNKDKRLLKTLKIASARWNTAKSNVAALYDFEIAKLYQQQGATYQPRTNETHRWKYKEALDICNAVIAAYPKSTGAEKCRVLKSQILSQSLQITVEELQSINSNALGLISYKNIGDINFKIGTVSNSDLDLLNRYNQPSEQLKILSKMKAIKSWSTHLRDEKDYQQHSTEIAIPKLENGRYVVFGQVQNETNTFAFKDIQVTNLAYFQNDNSSNVIYQIIDRNNGKPVSGAKVTLSYYKNYNGNYFSESYTTNLNGDIQVAKKTYSRSRLKLEIETKGDTARFENLNVSRYYNSRSSKSNKPNHQGFMFSDRSIYRPGQTLYFKGIVMTTIPEKSEVAANQSVAVTMYNTNGEQIKRLQFKTNDYGSIAGEFIIPNNGLTGNFSLRLTGNNNLNVYHSISVEEYKRPKFEAIFQPITETFKVNDTIRINGNAMAYAGSSITDAKVVYRVHRKVQYPRWYYWYRPAFNTEPQEITHGETTTDADGNFKIDFKALPDNTVDRSSLPIFNYEVTADITDINGETRSATSIVNVGYHALIATLAVPDQLDKTNINHSISISTKNLNGEFVSAKGSVKVYKLKAPNTVLRPRPWNAPDYQEFSKEDFKALFPHDAYTNEHNSNQWEKGELVVSKEFNTDISKTVNLGNMKRWRSGKYVIVLDSEDRFGQAVKDEVQTMIYSDADEILADHQLFSINMDKSEYAPGDTAEITFSSATSTLFVTVSIEKAGQIVSKQIIKLSTNKTTIKIPVTSEDQGGFIVHYSYAFHNSYKHGMNFVVVPYPKTDLEIETLTFRDKLQPGTDEIWSFKIKGPKGDKVAAELLASMYDTSLDQFKPHGWDFNPIQQPIYYSKYRLQTGASFSRKRFTVQNLRYGNGNYRLQNYDQLNYFGLDFGYGNRYLMRSDSALVEIEAEAVMDEAIMVMEDDSKEVMNVADFVASGKFRDSDNLDDPEYYFLMRTAKEIDRQNFDDIKIRKNLQEMAFFFPQLETDKEGNVSFSFTTPEALTKWKLQLLAHTKSLESAVSTLETVTQKELMVLPNAPRFLRHGDQITISTKIANLTDKALSGGAKLILTDAVSGKDITAHLGILPTGETVPFTVDAKGNTQASWSLSVPFDVDAVQYKILAKAGDFSDGEQNALPVLSNRMLVTETLPMWIKSNETRTFTLDKLKTNTSTTLKNHKLTLEMTSNPAWYAVQALPYLMEYPYDCNEQTFSRYYANALASHLVNSNPRIQEVFNQWRQTDALISNLEQNQELKSILIQETPWLRDTQSETEQKKRIALLFDLNKMTNELSSAKRKLENSQMNNGAWSWFNGGRANRYITQHIITGFGHLKQLNVRSSDVETYMISKALAYLDTEFVQEYEDIKKHNPKADLSKDHLSYTQLHYLYMRSFFPENAASKQVQDIIHYYNTQIQNYWLSRSLYAKGLMALVVHRNGDNITSEKILKSLRENSITSEELGMYWKANTNSWYWYQAPIETQALLIEAFSEIENDTVTVDNMKIWLLKNKQTNRWKTTKATTEAVYALLLQGSDWLSITDMVDVIIGRQAIRPSQLEDVKVEAGTGYYKTSWSGSEIQPEMATVSLAKKGDGIAWGSLYWQYFEDLDKITAAETPLKLQKSLFKKTNTDTGEEITELTSESKLEVGDLVRVRIELRSDLAMEFLHMKDMRAAGLEPVNVLSQYKWQDGLGYYESTKDASTNFFFDYLPKGVYVFEYDLRVTNTGEMSNGITTIQSMYAPEFSSHSEGVRISVKD